mmetsp:Transcript_11594/g.22064  ORF Transcript_11594/g.22064 Transcript_11594/m.22064 type:complete len:97 (-) Transcript_11594:47-337(-)
MVVFLVGIGADAPADVAVHHLVQGAEGHLPETGLGGESSNDDATDASSSITIGSEKDITGVRTTRQKGTAKGGRKWGGRCGSEVTQLLLLCAASLS